MKKVLWISRHQMTSEQYGDLKNIYGNISIVVVDRTINDINEIKEDVEASDIIAAVLPLEKMRQLLAIAQDKPVIRAESERIPTGRMLINGNGTKEKEYVFKHKYWEEIRYIAIETAKLS